MNWFLRARERFFHIKYQFDVGVGFLAVVNLGLLSLAASDKVSAFLGMKNGPGFVLGLVLAVLLSGLAVRIRHGPMGHGCATH